MFSGLLSDWKVDSQSTYTKNLALGKGSHDLSSWLCLCQRKTMTVAPAHGGICKPLAKPWPCILSGVHTFLLFEECRLQKGRNGKKR